MLDTNTLEMEVDSVSMPEKRLLLAMLELALRDLLSGSYNETRSAVAWFERINRVKEEDFISYKTVSENLELGASIYYKIKLMLAEGLSRKEAILKAEFDKALPGLCVKGSIAHERNARAVNRPKKIYF